MSWSYGRLARMLINEDDKQQIDKAAKSLFTEAVLAGLAEWYKYALQGRWRYIVFAVRRSYMMALIMEIITGIEMRVDSGDFLTDAALFLHCEEMAAEYREHGRFPRILLCDDIMIHGRNINHIIEGLQKRLACILGDKADRREIEEALASAIDIHVYMRTRGPLLLSGQYMRKLHYMIIAKLDFMHKFSSDCSAMILRSNLMNACYVYTEYLSQPQMDRIKDGLIRPGGFVHTIYQKIEQYTKFFYLGELSHVKIVMSLRIVKNACHDGYRVAPFVFLPNLGSGETAILLKKVLEKIPEKYRDLILSWKEMDGKRSFNELMTLLLSDAILKSFNRAYGIELDAEDQARELDKLARNYNQSGFGTARQMLEDLLVGDSVLSTNDIVEISRIAISDERIVLSLEKGSDVKLTSKDLDAIRNKVEDYFFERGRIDEEMAYELMRRPYYYTTLRSKRRVRGISFVLRELNEGMTKLESMYCMAYFLQMIDAGIGGMNSYAPNHLEVIGYAQFVKAGEQSLLIEPLRFYEYMPVLARMELECRRRMRELRDEIKEFGVTAGWDGNTIEQLIEFVDVLGSMGQTPMDWDGNYTGKIDKRNSADLWEMLQNQSALRHRYVCYAKEKSGYNINKNTGGKAEHGNYDTAGR